MALNQVDSIEVFIFTLRFNTEAKVKRRKLGCFSARAQSLAVIADFLSLATGGKIMVTQVILRG